MSQISANSSVIDKLGKSGIGLDKINYTLVLFHQLEPKIVHHEIYGVNSGYGVYYVEGDVSSFISGYNKFWVNNRKLSSDNFFEVDSVSFDSDANWTKIEISDSNYRVDNLDVGANICGYSDITDYVKNIKSISHQLFEDGSIANSVASQISFELNDEDRIFYNRNDKSGFFYKKDVISEVKTYQSESLFSPKSGVFTTFIKVKYIPEYWNGSDFINGRIEFITGKSAGSKSIIFDSNGYNLNVLGHYSKNYLTNKFHKEIKPVDKLRLYKSDIFWFKLDIDFSGESDTVSVCGKLDVDTIKVNDRERWLSIEGYDTIKDLQNKYLSDLDFDSGLNLQRLLEFKPLMIDQPIRKEFKTIVRKKLPEDPLQSVRVEQVGFDVGVGWHLLDFNPYGNLFRFDYGKWYRAIDEGSFEKSTNQIFITSCEDSEILGSEAARLPAHDGMWRGEVLGYQNTPPGTPSTDDTYLVGDSPTGAWANKEQMIAIWTGSTWYFEYPHFGDRVYDSGTPASYAYDGDTWTTNIDFVNNLYAERLWHGRWCGITIQVKEDQNVSGNNGMIMGSGNTKFKKFYNLPIFPFKKLFYVNEDRTISHQLNFSYSYDKGSSVIPHYLFDYIIEYNKTDDEIERDITYLINSGTLMNVSANYRKPLAWTSSTDHMSLRCYHSRPFNGIFINFDNSGGRNLSLNPSSFETFGTSILSHMQIRFSNGDGFGANEAIKYSGGKIISLTNQTTFRLAINVLSDSYDDNYTKIEGMRLISLNGDNFLDYRKISGISDSGNLDEIDLIIEKAFDNSISTGDIFIIINKNFNLKLHDLGDAFKPDEEPDVKAFYRIGTETYEDVNYTKPLDQMGIRNYTMQKNSKIFLGHRKKFSAIYIEFNTEVAASDDYADVAYFLKSGKFVIEYYDGNNWKSARNVIMIPTTVLPLVDDDTYANDSDDYVKYKIMFSADDWNTGGYDHTLWSDGDDDSAPSSIDEDEIYLIRITILDEISLEFTRVGIAKTDETCLMLCWDNYDKWQPNLLNIENGQILVDTLKNEDTYLPFFGVELIQYREEGEDPYTHVSSMLIRQVKPVTKFEGYSEDNIFAVIDHNNIDIDKIDLIGKDLLMSNPDKDNGIAYFPKNISYHYFMDKILNNIGFERNKNNLSFRDRYNKDDKPHLSILGSDYDGIYPFEVGWDLAIVNENFKDYFTTNIDSGSYRNLSCLRYFGYYYVWAVRNDRTNIDVWRSEDLVTWSLYSSNIVDGRTAEEILAIEMVHNKSDDYFSYYVTYRDDSNGTYKVGVYNNLSTTYLNIGSINDILVDVSNNYGELTALQLEGSANSSSANARIMWVTRYSGTGISSGVPTGTPSILLYTNEDAAVSGTWTLRDTRSGFKEPIFISANYSNSVYSPFNNGKLDTAVIIAKNYNNDKIFRIMSDDPTVGMKGTWSSIELIKDTALSYTGMTCVNDGIIYNLRDGSNISAFNLVPSNPDCNIILGLDGSQIVTPIAINNDTSDWNEDGYWKNLNIEMNELDWFRSDSNELVFDRYASDQNKRKRLFLGFRKTFDKIDCVSNSNSYFTKLLQIKYWNGYSLQSISNIYQNNELRTDGKFHPNMGFSFVPPLDWVSGTINEVTSNYDALDMKQNALYWVEISLGDYADSDDEVSMKRFQNCYTNLFLTKDRNLFLMENWKYTKSVYSYPFESDRNIKIDSISYDKELKLVFVNYIEDNPYKYVQADTLVFDIFGKFKLPNFIRLNETYEGVNQYNIVKDRPVSIYRRGYDAQYDDETDRYAGLIGAWTEEYLEYLQDNASLLSDNAVGYNVPVPFPQLIRKYMNIGADWQSIGSSYVSESVLNNILVSKRSSLSNYPSDTYNFNDTKRRNFFSITNNGLLYEELINAPYAKVEKGFYAFNEKNYFVWSRYYDWLIIDDVIESSLPGSPNIGDAYILEDATKAGTIVWYNGSSWVEVKPTIGIVVYLQMHAKYVQWDGDSWKDLPNFANTLLWPGRILRWLTEKELYGIGLEWTLGQEGVKIDYFRPLNLRPNRFLNNNVIKSLDYKICESMRHVHLSFDGENVFGHDLYYSDFDDILDKNLKPTCAALLKDLSSMKDNSGPTDSFDTRIIDSNNPGIVFGSYHFIDYPFNPASGFPTRYNSGTDAIQPLATMGINLFKSHGKVRNWNQAWEYDNGTASYSDITDDMNYRGNTTYTLDSSGDFIYLASDTKCFALAINKADDYDLDLDIQVYCADGVGWESVNSLVVDKITEEMDTWINQDQWAIKTAAHVIVWNPYKLQQIKTTVNGVNGYWVRIRYNLVGGNHNQIRWVNNSGSVLFDSERWWDYTITSEQKPTITPPSSQEDARFFDSYVPVSIDYDESRNRITGCFWNYSVDRFYPFIIQFKRDRIKSDSYNMWSWEVDYIEIIDEDGLDYSYKIQSIKNISPLENKAILIKDSKPDGQAIMANIKNYSDEDTVFINDLE